MSVNGMLQPSDQFQLRVPALPQSPLHRSCVVVPINRWFAEAGRLTCAGLVSCGVFSAACQPMTSHLMGSSGAQVQLPPEIWRSKSAQEHASAEQSHQPEPRHKVGADSLLALRVVGAIDNPGHPEASFSVHLFGLQTLYDIGAKPGETWSAVRVPVQLATWENQHSGDRFDCGLSEFTVSNYRVLGLLAVDDRGNICSADIAGVGGLDTKTSTEVPLRDFGVASLTPATGQVEVTIRDSNGLPIVGATVFCIPSEDGWWWLDDLAYPNVLLSAAFAERIGFRVCKITNPTGVALFDSLPRNGEGVTQYKIFGFHDECLIGQELVEARGGNTGKCSLECVRLTELEVVGSLSDVDGRPIVGGSVWFANGPFTVTRSDGSWRLPPRIAGPGPWKVCAYSDGYEEFEEEIGWKTLLEEAPHMRIVLVRRQ